MGRLLVFAFVVSMIGAAIARDDDGHHVQNDPAMHQWFDKLASGKGLCCSFIDGTKIEDIDWDTKDNHYRVRIDGQWIDVPDAAVVKESNRFGAAVVWQYKDADGKTQIRCFLPGSGA